MEARFPALVPWVKQGPPHTPGSGKTFLMALGQARPASGQALGGLFSLLLSVRTLASGNDFNPHSK